MTRREHKRLCRIKVERLAKIITFTLVMITLSAGYLIPIDGYIVGAISTCLWFWMPDLAAYALETYYKLTHNKVTYR